jgi:hypothetical protein
MAVPPLPSSVPKQAPRKLVDVHKAAMQAQRGLNRNMLVLGVTALLLLGGLAAFLASRNAGNIFNIFQNTTNNIIHNNYFTQLIANGTTTMEDLKSIEEIRPYGDGFIGISKAQLNWSQAGDLAKRTGSEVLAVEDSPTVKKQQLIEWLKTTFAAQFQPTLWVRQDGQAKVTDGNDVLAGTSLESTRKVTLHWKSNAGRTTSDPALATKEQPFENSLGMKFVPVPITGGPTDGKKVLFSIWETRVRDYEAFATDTKREWPDAGFVQGPNHPAVMVSWEDAQAFCVRLTEQERSAGRLGGNDRYRLPTDHEWSAAVGIADREDFAKLPNLKSRHVPNVFPWGRDWEPPPGAGNYAGSELLPLIAAGKHTQLKNHVAGFTYEDGHTETANVGSFSANHLGLHDLGGNVWEWCEGWLSESHKFRVSRGGGWMESRRNHLLSSNRGFYAQGSRLPDYGFRVVLEVAAGNFSAALPKDPNRERALSLITRLGGRYELEAGSSESPPPVIGVDLAGNETVSDADLLQLKCLTRLRKLNLNGCPKSIHDEGMALLAEMPELETLDLGHCYGITEAVLENLSGLRKLTSLSLKETGVVGDGAGLHHLKALTSLRLLNLAYSVNLEDRYVEDLAGLTNLRDLNLMRCAKLTDAAMDHVGRLSSLEKLNLAGTQVTDAGMQKLEGLKHLKEITLSSQEPLQQTKVTDAGVAELQTAIPGLKVTR